MRGPTSSTRSSSSAVAFSSASIEPNSCASNSAVRSPTKRMPRPMSTRASPRFLRAFNLLEQRARRFLRKPFEPDQLLLGQLVEIGHALHQSAIQQLLHHAPRPALRYSSRRGCQSAAGSRAAWRGSRHSRSGNPLRPLARTTALPHSGQCGWENETARSRAGCSASSTTSTTLGITSPPRSTFTQSPISKPRRSMKSALCSVARLTVVPPMNTGVNSADGVSLPVRPTVQVMSLTCVIARLWR